MSPNEGTVAHDSDDENAGTPRADDSAPSVAPWEQRILQLDGKRYSLRLEHEFWAVLEQIAERRHLRLNRLIADIANKCPPESNLSSTLRVFCLTEIQRAGTTRGAGLDRGNVLALADSAPTPCLVIDADQTIIGINEAMLCWSNLARDALMDGKVTDHFRFQTDGDAETLWARLAEEGAPSERAIMVNITPGRVLAADALLVPIPGGRGRRMCLAWVKV